MTNSSPGIPALWSGQAHMPSVLGRQLVIVEGTGAYVTTSAGQTLLDATSGLWHANIGHGRTEIADAVAAQIRKLETYHVFGRFANEVALTLAERLVKLAPVDNAKVIMTSGGSDSADLAFKLARRHWQVQGRPDKRIILSRERSYHGLHAFGTSVTGIEFNREGYGGPSLVPETRRVPTHDLDGIAAVVAEVGAENIAAIVAEPIMGTGGVIPPAPGFLPGLQKLANDNDILFIADEVITGFGRAGAMFACERFGVQPDMVLMAKGLTSGYLPLGGLLVAPGIWGRFYRENAPVFRHGLTYSGHATASVAAHANIDILEKEFLVERSAALESVLHDALSSLSSASGVREVRSGVGFMAGVELDEGVNGEAVSEHCIDAGVIIRCLPGNTMQICPPFIVTEDEIDRIAETLTTAIETVNARPTAAARGV
ncbi:aspartate aminotransferase family protein [Rhodococcus sp. NPDC060176]|uniref:aminotransferase family protein n=1 Tax=Rhodococcus sp. NPDC060176 TaxID=3347062 RepID=UPI00364C14CB